MTLQPQERRAIVAYRLEKAHHTIKEIKDISKLGYWNLAANRLYYAAYHASIALLIWKNIEAFAHKDVIQMIGENFVKSGLLNQDDTKLFGRLMIMRHAGDYEDLADCEESDVAPLIPRVEEYISRIARIIEADE